MTAALTSGLVSQAQLNDHVRRYLRTLFAFGVFDRSGFPDNEAAIDRAAHAARAQQMEEGAITLLRDQDGILPLNPARTKSIAVIGKVANSFITGDLQCLTLECPTAYGNQDALISAVAAANPNTIVLLEAGGPVLTPWRTQVKGLLDAWYPGESGGSAIAQVLFGDIDPSGHLPLTFPGAESQEPTYGDPSSYPGIGIDETYREGAFVGYRWFDAHGLTPAYPFGFGLSYTSFRYSGLRITRLEAGARVSFTVTNVGSRAGSALPQLYLGLSSLPGIPEPPAQLEGFAKVPLAPGQQTRVRFVVESRALSYWDVSTGSWSIAPGCDRVMVGSSSREDPLRGLRASRALTARRRGSP